MSEVQTNQEGSTLTIELDEGLYPKDAIYSAAYIFIDRCYVRLDRPKADKISVQLKLKEGVERSLDEMAGEFQNELLTQAWRSQIVDESQSLIEQVTTQALAGAAGPPGLDDLLAMDIDDESAFDDPLGIAMSWEDKYQKKSGVDEKSDASKEGE